MTDKAVMEIIGNGSSAILIIDHRIAIKTFSSSIDMLGRAIRQNRKNFNRSNPKSMQDFLGHINDCISEIEGMPYPEKIDKLKEKLNEQTESPNQTTRASTDV